MLNKKIERITIEILKTQNISKIPVPIENIVLQHNLEIKPCDLGDDVSGVLVMEAGRGSIGYNPTESKVRQRFTIAHEFGHYILHKEHSALFIDKGYTMLFRHQTQTSHEIKKEYEANAFAAALLMPEEHLVKEIEIHKFDLSEEECMKQLAKVFHVSIPAMTYRIANLNLFWKI